MSLIVRVELHCFHAASHNNYARFIGGKMILTFTKSTTASIQKPFSQKAPFLYFIINKNSAYSAAFIMRIVAKLIIFCC